MLKKAHSSNKIRAFFARSDHLDRMTLRPLSHITSSWETQWDLESERYEPEYDSFADDLNVVIEQLANCASPASYHSHEDQLAENTLRELKWPIQKKKGRWIGADYAAILEQGAFGEMPNLISAACGRVHAAIDHGQAHFDEMEDSHLVMLSALITIIIYHRDCNGTSLRLALPDPDALDDAVVSELQQAQGVQGRGTYPRNRSPHTEYRVQNIAAERPGKGSQYSPAGQS